MKNPQEKENGNKKLRRHVCIIGDFMVRHITVSGISKNDHVQVKPYQDAATDNIKNQILLLSILERKT